MRVLVPVVVLALMASCDRTESLVFSDYHDFDNRVWAMADTVKFRFQIADTTRAYNLFCQFRNSRDYPWDRVYVNWMLQDSANRVIEKSLLSIRLFEKSGKPLGSTSMGSIYDHHQVILRAYRFGSAGRYTLTFTQMMRLDSVKGVPSVGFRVEKELPN
ncbi:MAG TPA: hypothetical protein DCE81_04805 [Cytophagales bacterium]|nr:hypothetical protein [Cytophagales bacterium]